MGYIKTAYAVVKKISNVPEIPVAIAKRSSQILFTLSNTKSSFDISHKAAIIAAIPV